MAHPVVQIANLSHRYSKTWALSNVTFSIDGPGIFGLLGANGAGKSTCMNVICGVIQPTSGDVAVQGMSMRRTSLRAKREIGFLPQQPPLHLELTVDEYLRHCAGLRGMTGAGARAAIESTKEKCGIAHFSRRLIGALSGGYRQRVGLAQAILHSPSLVVFDEPTNGLDPNQIASVRKLIRDISHDRTVLLSTHILSEVAANCSSLIMFDNGRIVFDGSIDEFRNVIREPEIVVQLSTRVSTDTLASLPGVLKAREIEPMRYRLYPSERDAALGSVVEASASERWGLRELRQRSVGLEEVFTYLSADSSVS